MRPTVTRYILCLLSLSLITGCYDKTVNGDKITMTCSPWAIQLIVGLSIGALVVAFVLRKRSIAVPLSFAGIGLVGFLLILPAAQLDNVVVDDEHYERNGGVTYFYRVRDEIKFKEVSRIEIILEKERRAKGGVQYNYYFVVTDKGSNESKRLPIGDMARLMIVDVVQRARKQGVEFFNSSDLAI